MEDGRPATVDWLLNRAATRNPKSYLATIRNEIRALLALQLQESELKGLLLDEFAVALNLASRGYTASTWLHHVLDQIDAEIAKRQPI
ncbi:MAG: hypothetical protein NVSMB64_32610 [Candidatus Velthaea sp.]